MGSGGGPELDEGLAWPLLLEHEAIGLAQAERPLGREQGEGGAVALGEDNPLGILQEEGGRRGVYRDDPEAGALGQGGEGEGSLLERGGPWQPGGHPRGAALAEVQEPLGQIIGKFSTPAAIPRREGEGGRGGRWRGR